MSLRGEGTVAKRERREGENDKKREFREEGEEGGDRRTEREREREEGRILLVESDHF